jgi:uncharacterized protein YjiK
MKFTLSLFILALCFSCTTAQSVYKIKPKKKVNIAVPEPSDICLAEDKQSYYVVSDDGLLFQLDLDFKVIKKSKLQFNDAEGVIHYKGKVYVVEERIRMVAIVDMNEDEIVAKKEIPYAGGRNKGFESICYNTAREKFILFTEKDPITLFEVTQLDAEGVAAQVTNRKEIDLSGDISSVTFYKGRLYVLSDENHCVYRMNPNTYKVEVTWKIAVLNPEGICFSPSGDLIIVSDDMQEVNIFDFPTE